MGIYDRLFGRKKAGTTNDSIKEDGAVEANATVREFCASDKSWRNADSPGSLVGDGIQIVEGTLAGKVIKVALIVVQDIESLENNPEFVRQIRQVAKEAGNIHIDEQSVNNIRAFDLSLYNAIFQGKRLW
ncbi:MAG: hypothetical protein JRI51_12535 [Deltaproteobacteria bacterium]|nr:hypothetical protein [Deltaproteobacteria bacterium]